jgi:hypothetical protein
MNDNDARPRVVRFPPGGPLKFSRIEPGKYVATRLVSELADAWKDFAETASLTPGTVSRQSRVVRKVGEFLTDDADKFLTMSGDGEEVVRRLHDWESAMVTQFPPPSVRAKDLGMEVRNQVARHLQSNGIFTGVLADWASGTVLDGSRFQSLPLDEYSNHERLQLEQTCRGIVRATEDRLARGETLLTQGKDPRRHGWDRLENVLWAMRNLPFKESFRPHLTGPRLRLDGREIDQISGGAPARGRH